MRDVLVCALVLSLVGVVRAKSDPKEAERFIAATTPISRALDTPAMSMIFEQRERIAIYTTAFFALEKVPGVGNIGSDRMPSFDDPPCAEPFSAFADHLQKSTASELKATRDPAVGLREIASNGNLRRFGDFEVLRFALLRAVLESPERALWIRAAEHEAATQTWVKRNDGAGWPSVEVVMSLIPTLATSNDALGAWIQANPPPAPAALEASIQRLAAQRPLKDLLAQRTVDERDAFLSHGAAGVVGSLPNVLLEPNQVALNKHLFFFEFHSSFSETAQRALDQIPAKLAAELRVCVKTNAPHDKQRLRLLGPEKIRAEEEEAARFASLWKRLTTPEIERYLYAFFTARARDLGQKHHCKFDLTQHRATLKHALSAAMDPRSVATLLREPRNESDEREGTSRLWPILLDSADGALWSHVFSSSLLGYTGTMVRKGWVTRDLLKALRAIPQAPSDQQVDEARERLLKAPPPELRAIPQYEGRMMAVWPSASGGLAQLYFYFVAQEFGRLEAAWRERAKSSGKCRGL